MEPDLLVDPSTLNRGRSLASLLKGSFSHLAYVRFMKFSVAPESSSAAVTGIQGRKPRLVVWLRTGVSSGNRPTNVIESTENTARIARRLGCLECLGHLSWMPWESSGISEIARATKRTLLLLMD